MLATGHRVHVTDNGWQNWHTIEIGYTNALQRFDFITNDYGIAVGFGNVHITTDGGINWQRVNEKFRQIDFFNADSGIIVQQVPNKEPLRTVDGGITWEPFATGSEGFIQSIDLISPTCGFMATSNSEFLITIDAGNNWQVQGLPFDSVYYKDIQFFNESTGYLCASNGAVLKTTNAGETWNYYNFDTITQLSAIYFISELHGWVVGSPYFCAITHDGSITWEIIPLPDYYPKDIWFTNDSTGYIVTWNGHLLTSYDGGFSWQSQTVTTNLPFKIDFVNESQGRIVTSPSIWYTEDGGMTWFSEFSIVPNNSDKITGYARFDENRAWICTDGGGVYSKECLVLKKLDRFWVKY
jgi:photosystem II stability/assembly factor-like uncharacterized protein